MVLPSWFSRTSSDLEAIYVLSCFVRPGGSVKSAILISDRPPPCLSLKPTRRGLSCLCQESDAMTNEKPYLEWDAQVRLLRDRGLVIDDEKQCRSFLTENNYYRFSGYARYFQKSPEYDDNNFEKATTFASIKSIYEADEALRPMLLRRLSRVEVMLRSHTAYVIGREYGPYNKYLEPAFYVDVADEENVASKCIKDIGRSKERFIQHFCVSGASSDGMRDYSGIPIWAAVETWSFGTLSKCIERGGKDDSGHARLENQVAESMGQRRTGFAGRVKALVYLRNRCAHHDRLWNHSVLDAGPTLNIDRKKTRKITGQFSARSIMDIVASLDGFTKSTTMEPIAQEIAGTFKRNDLYWEGLLYPTPPTDHKSQFD